MAAPQTSPDTPGVAVRLEYFLTPVPSWNPERDSKGQELSDVVPLNHPKVTLSFYRLLRICARDVEIMITTKQSFYHFPTTYEDQGLICYSLRRAMVTTTSSTYLFSWETQGGQIESVHGSLPYPQGYVPEATERAKP